MSGGQYKAPCGVTTDTGQDGNRNAKAAGTISIQVNQTKRLWLTKLWAALIALAAGVAP